jgi:hypothetical protein
MTPALIRRWLRPFLAWQSRQRLYRAYPVLRELDRKQAEYRRSHKRGSARINKARIKAMTAALAKGVR